MHKHKQGSHPKAEAARSRKADQKTASFLAEETAKQEAYWRDEDKLSQRKIQRRADKESKRIEGLDRRAELKKLEADETEQIDSEIQPKSEYTFHCPYL